MIELKFLFGLLIFDDCYQGRLQQVEQLTGFDPYLVGSNQGPLWQIRNQLSRTSEQIHCFGVTRTNLSEHSKSKPSLFGTAHPFLAPNCCFQRCHEALLRDLYCELWRLGDWVWSSVYLNHRVVSPASQAMNVSSPLGSKPASPDSPTETAKTKDYIAPGF